MNCGVVTDRQLEEVAASTLIRARTGPWVRAGSEVEGCCFAWVGVSRFAARENDAAVDDLRRCSSYRASRDTGTCRFRATVIPRSKAAAGAVQEVGYVFAESFSTEAEAMKAAH